jgi:photosystem II stability/assembly factor-like uncharacterized protein
MPVSATSSTRLARAAAGAAICTMLTSGVVRGQARQIDWQRVDVHTNASFRGLSVAQDGSIWVGGTQGIVLESRDGGRTWTADTVSGATHFDFRGMAAIDSATAYAMVASADTGRIYKTTDRGKSWLLQYEDERRGVFLDGMACWNSQRCIAAGDPIAGHFVVVATEDGGSRWSRLAEPAAPAAAPGEAAFAASNTSVIVGPDGLAWIATGAGQVARVWRSSDFGATWRVADTPLSAGPSSAGVFSLAFCTGGVAVGGDFQTPDSTGAHVALSSDDGATWRLSDAAHATPYLSGVACRASPGGQQLVAVGPAGTFAASDGVHWSRASRSGFNAVAFAAGALVAVGDKGSVAWADANPGTTR